MNALSIHIVGAFAAVAALAAAMLPALAAADVPSEQVPNDLRAQIEQHIEARGYEFAGLCGDVNASPNPGQYVGQWCAFVQTIEHDIAEVSFGPVLSATLYRTSFKHEGNSWTLMSSDEFPDNPGTPTSTPPKTSTGGSKTPGVPNTGSGHVTGHEDDVARVFLPGAGIAMALGFGAAGLAVARKR